MSAQDNNDAMTSATSETQKPLRTGLPVVVQTGPFLVPDEDPLPELPEDNSYPFLTDDGRLIPDSELSPIPYTEDYSDAPPEIRHKLLYWSGYFAPTAQGLIVEYPNGERHELSFVVARIYECLLDGVDHAFYPLDDIGISNLFADSYKYMLRYVTDAKEWYVYDMKKGVWAPGGIKAMECCKDFVQMLKYEVNILCRTDDSVSRRLKSAVEDWQSESSRKKILRDALSRHPISKSGFDKDPFIFNCTNGTLNFRTWRFTPHNPMDFLAKSANVAYDPKAKCPRWGEHMGEVLLERQDLGIYLQKALGYSLTGDTRFECFFVLFGPTGRNGKGVTMSTFAHMLGDYACNANPETLMEKKYSNGSAPSEDIARLAGARYVTFSESEEQKALSSALVKTLTGNDTVTARRLYENSFEYKPTYKMFIGTNELPKVTDPVIFTSGRARVIPFDKTFEEWEQNPGLKNELIRPLAKIRKSDKIGA